MTAGWSPGAVVLARITGAAVLLMPFALWSLRGQWRAIRRELPRVALYGTLAVAAAQLGYFQAVSRMDVGIALLIEYLGIVLVVLWVWALTHQRPHRLTVVGIVLALLGLALVLDVTGQSTPPLVRRALGPGRRRRPGRSLRARRPADRHPVDRLRRAGPDRRRRRARRARRSSGCCRWTSATRPCRSRAPASRPGWPWPSWSSWPPPSPTCSASSVPACSGRPWRRSSASPRCSSRCCSPGCCSRSCPGVLQLVGGAVLLSGVVAVRLGERDLARAAGARDAAAETDLDVPSHRRLDSGGCLGEGRRTGQGCPV